MEIESKNLIQALNKYFEGYELKRKNALDAANLIINLIDKFEEEHQHRIDAENHADAFLKDCKNLSLKLENMNNQGKIIIKKDKWGIKHKKCPFCGEELRWKKINYCSNCGAKLI